MTSETTAVANVGSLYSHYIFDAGLFYGVSFEIRWQSDIQVHGSIWQEDNKK
jgi:hypothetical protein